MKSMCDVYAQMCTYTSHVCMSRLWVSYVIPWQFLTEGLGKRGIQKKQHKYKKEKPLNLQKKAEKKHCFKVASSSFVKFIYCNGEQAYNYAVPLQQK